ncbi:glycerate kinase type-2 family protein [Caldimonas brevitalea]|uniref:Hydroxypyruvate reductase n=1 Tax=Caldimonas brevitalea TaxID=413882 RepID=A0A0G3BKY5_9BURK|nr:glycerate kinase [Caldimonas brevitalea]AKJ28021.1 hydroxypyruvate reductase [Caldimonas brevitalea]
MPHLLDSPAEWLRHLFDTAVARAQPDHGLAALLPPPPRGRTLVIGAGKAAASMALAVDRLWPSDAPLSGLVVTRYGHCPPGARGGRVEVIEAGHPVPDDAGLQAARRIVGATGGLSADDLVLCLMSGGGSALLAWPAEGVTLQDKRAVNQALLHSGATIAEINCVRKHLSAVKGGRLGARCAPARMVTLLISDVPGDDPAVIASGPTVPDPTSCADALDILARYRIEVPQAVHAALHSGRLETPKPGDPRFDGHQVHLLATPQQALEAAAAAARQAGVAAYLLSDAIEGESRVVGQVHAALARQVARHGQPFARPCVMLSGGETTVTVAGPAGRGGRATEFLLGAALTLQGEPNVWMLAADTDGIDGVEDNAGALLTPQSWAQAAQQGLKAQDFLDRHDAYGYFERLGGLLYTGPTYTNVNDFRAVLVL